MDTSDRDERLSLVDNIKSQWKLANPTDSIPEDMRYPGHIGTWPLPILRAMSYLAGCMPGDEGRLQFVHFLNNGHLMRKADADESATFEPRLQPSDLEYVRECVGLEPASERVADADQSSNREGNSDAASKSGEPSNEPTIQQRIDGAASVRNDVANPRQRPESILPEDKLETLNVKGNRWIEYYRNVTDARSLVPEHMRQRERSEAPANRALHSYRNQENLLKLLYQLARITKG